MRGGAGNSHVALGFSCTLTQSRDQGTGLWETCCPLPAVVCSGSAFPLALRVSEGCYISCD